LRDASIVKIWHSFIANIHSWLCERLWTKSYIFNIYCFCNQFLWSTTHPLWSRV